MAVRIDQIGPEQWALYAQVPTRYEVTSLLQSRVLGDGLGGMALREVAADPPSTKEFDADDIPATWAKTFDLRAWGIFLATDEGRPIGAAAVASPSPNIFGLEHRTDAAALFDLRIAPDSRRRGTGTALIRRCAQWAKANGFRALTIETQNVNVAACRLYASCGAELLEIRRYGYAQFDEVAKEAMLIWQIAL